MSWIQELFFGQSVAHSILVIALVVTTGIFLGRVKIFGISLGITWILFAGIAFSHFGMEVDSHTLHFVKEFGLILFVYSIGLQVGPSFFSSFRKGGIKLNMLAAAGVLVSVGVTYLISNYTGTSIITMVGILSGAVTNTPGLGAAQQAYTDIKGATEPTIAMGYAVAYPLGVVGIILSMILIRVIFKIDRVKEDEKMKALDTYKAKAQQVTVEIENSEVFGKTINDIMAMLPKNPFVVSRTYHPNGEMELVSNTTVVEKGDRLYIVTAAANIDAIVKLLGQKVDMDFEAWQKLGTKLVSHRLILTKRQLNGKHIGDLKLRKDFGVNITRVNRSGVDLIATSALRLQVGDLVTIIGDEEKVKEVENLLGNSLKHLREPNLIVIFFGIFFGVILGSIPLLIPGIPQPVKLGLAGGPLIIAIIISRFGPKYHINTYTTVSVNMMLRELGISLFLAAVGIGAGADFVDTIINKGGYSWIMYGFIITVVPLMFVGIIGRMIFKLNYHTLMGLIAGSTTDPPALAYANATSDNDVPAVAYATVYPLTMFLRVISAQTMILLALG